MVNEVNPDKNQENPLLIQENSDKNNVFAKLSAKIQMATRAGIVLVMSAVSTNAMASEVKPLCGLVGEKFYAQEDKECMTEYKTKIGIDYLELTSGDVQLANILMKGEEEFFSNIGKVIEYKGGGKRYTTKKRQVRRWTQIVKTIGKGDLNKNQLKILEVSSMKMLFSFSTLDEKKYKNLHTIGEYEKELSLSKALRGI